MFNYQDLYFRILTVYFNYCKQETDGRSYLLYEFGLTSNNPSLWDLPTDFRRLTFFQTSHAFRPVIGIIIIHYFRRVHIVEKFTY
jgi:hypothetical protein